MILMSPQNVILNRKLFLIFKSYFMSFKIVHTDLFYLTGPIMAKLPQ